MHNITDTNKLDKMGETARTVSRAGQKPAHTAMDYALGAQAVNTEILRRTSQAWKRYPVWGMRLSPGSSYRGRVVQLGGADHPAPSWKGNIGHV